MQRIPPLRTVLRILPGVAITLGLLLLAVACPKIDRTIETAVANTAQTAIAKGQNQAATQVIIVKETAVAAAATQAVQLKQTVVAAAATKAVELKQTVEAEIATRIAPKSPAVKPEVQAARDTLKAMSAMQTHWRQVTAPLPEHARPPQRQSLCRCDRSV